MKTTFNLGLSCDTVNIMLETLKRLRVAYIPKEHIPFNKDFPMFLTEAEDGFVCLASGYRESPYYKFPSIREET